MKKFKILSLAVFPLLLGTLVGCGGGDQPSSSKSETSTSSASSTTAPSSTSTGSSTTSIPSSSSIEPVVTDAYVIIDDEEFPMIEYEETIGSPTAAFKLEGQVLFGGEDIVFKYLDAAITTNIGADDPDCNADVTTDEFDQVTITVHNAAIDAGIYFKVWDDGFSFWIDGREEDPETSIRLVGSFDGWGDGIAMDLVEGSSSEYYITLDFEVGDALKVRDIDGGDTGWYGYTAVKSGCKSLVTSDKDGNIVIITTASTTIYFDYDAATSGQPSIWIENGETPVTKTDIDLMGIDGDWSVGKEMTLKEEGSSEYVITTTIATTDEFKVRDNREGANLWFGFAHIKDACADLVVAGEGEGDANIKVKEDGEYTIYWDSSIEGKSIYISKKSEPVPEISAFKYKLNEGELVDLTPTEKKGEEAWDKQFTTTFVTITKGARIDFYAVIEGEATLFTTCKPNGDDETKLIQNNLKPATAKGVDWTVLKDAENATLYLEKYSDGYKFWLQGGPELKTGYYLLINNETFVELTENKPTPEGFDKEVKATEVPLEAEDTFVIYNADDDAKWTPTLDKYSTEKVTLSGDHYVVSEAGSYDFYLKLVYEGDLLYVGEHQSPVPFEAPRVMGVDGDWTTGVEMVPVSEGSTEYVLSDVPFEADDTFKIKLGEAWFGAEEIKSDCKVVVDDGSENHNIKVLADGTYDIYFETEPQEGAKRIRVNMDEPSLSYGVTVNGGYSKLGFSGDATYKIEKASMPKNAVICVASKDGEVVTELTIPEGALELDDRILENFAVEGKGLKVLIEGTYDFEITFVGGVVTKLYIKEYEAPATISVTVSVHYHCDYGDSVYIVGNMSSWKLSPDFKLEYGEGDVWSATFIVPKGMEISYKLAIGASDAKAGDTYKRIEAGSDRVLPTSADIVLNLSWQE